jgi:hypothetical protein
MTYFTAFYYSRSFSAFHKPYTPFYYLKAPRYLRHPNLSKAVVSSPFILNYFNKKYNFSATVLGAGLLSSSALQAAYRAVPKSTFHFALLTQFAPTQPIALQYVPNNKNAIYRRIFFQTFFFYFFQYRLLQTRQLLVQPKVSANSSFSNIIKP